MKTRHLVFPFLVFAVFVIAGHWTGKQIERSVISSDQGDVQRARLVEQIASDKADWVDDSFAPQRSSTLPVPTSEQTQQRIQQKNILVIGVDHLDAPQPRLEAVWLALYLPNMPQLYLMPLYPSVIPDGDNLNIQVNDLYPGLFDLTPGGAPDPDFLELLDEQEIWWTNYIVLDSNALAGVVDYSGGVESVDRRQKNKLEKLDGEQALASIPNTLEDPQGAIFSQVQLIQRLCQKSPQLDFSLIRIDKLLSSLHEHIHTDLTAQQVVDDIDSMQAFGGGFVCEFPSITLVQSTQ